MWRPEGSGMFQFRQGRGGRPLPAGCVSNLPMQLSVQRAACVCACLEALCGSDPTWSQQGATCRLPVLMWTHEMSQREQTGCSRLASERYLLFSSLLLLRPSGNKIHSFSQDDQGSKVKLHSGRRRFNTVSLKSSTQAASECYHNYLDLH